MKIIPVNLQEETLSNEIEISENSEYQIIFFGKEEDNFSAKIVFNHKKPDLNSKIRIKAVLKDNSRFDLEALLKIEKGAKNVNTFLKIDTLMIGEKASSRIIPSLEIKENEVKAGHGATVGYILPEHIFYLKSRGLDQIEIEDLVVEAFFKF